MVHKSVHMYIHIHDEMKRTSCLNDPNKIRWVKNMGQNCEEMNKVDGENTRKLELEMYLRSDN